MEDVHAPENVTGTLHNVDHISGVCEFDERL